METRKQAVDYAASQNRPKNRSGNKRIEENGGSDDADEKSDQEQVICGIDVDHINLLTTMHSDDESVGEVEDSELTIDPRSVLMSTRNDMAAIDSGSNETEQTSVKPKGSGHIYRCHLCPRTFTWLKSLTVHVRIHTGEKPYKCHLCSRAFVRSDYLKYHMKSHSNEEQFRCEECNIVFATMRALKRHNKAEHHQNGTGDVSFRDEEEDYSCIYCDKTFDDELKQRAHIHVHEGNLPFPCNLCDKAFIRADYLQSHRNWHVRKQQEDDQDNDDDDEEEHHMEIVPEIMIESDSEEEDDQDDKLPSTEQDSLLAKLLTQIVRTDDNRFQCPSCPKTFAHDTTLRMHLRTHTGFKPYNCNLCPASFIRSDYLKAHMKKHANNHEVLTEHLYVHQANVDAMVEDDKNASEALYTKTEDNKFQCNVCERIVAHLQTMKIHLRIHTNEKPYRCYVCNESFIRGDYLKNHMKGHFKEGIISSNGVGIQLAVNGGGDDDADYVNFTPLDGGRWICNICQKIFLHSSSLKNHSKFHSSEKSHYCESCDKSFARVDYLKEHYKSKKHQQMAALVRSTDSNFEGSYNEEILGDDANDEYGPSQIGDEIKQEILDDDEQASNSTNNASNEPPPLQSQSPQKSPKKNRLLVFPKTLALAENINFLRTEDGRYHCSFCDRSFVTPTTLKVHLRIHTNEKPYRCLKCNRGFIRSDYLRAHQKIHKETIQENFLNNLALTYKENAEYQTEVEPNFLDFLEDDLGEEEEEVLPMPPDEYNEEEEEDELLEEKSTYVDDENDHDYVDVPEQMPRPAKRKRRNSDDIDARAKYECHMCDKRFVWPKSLKIHIRTHTGERPYQCDMCNKCFNRSDSLRGHKKTHLTERNLICEICQTKFVHINSLMKHQQTTHGIDPTAAGTGDVVFLN